MGEKSMCLNDPLVGASRRGISAWSHRSNRLGFKRSRGKRAVKLPLDSVFSSKINSKEPLPMAQSLKRQNDGQKSPLRPVFEPVFAGTDLRKGTWLGETTMDQ